MLPLPPFNLRKWIDEHRHLLKPPVGNQQLYKDSEFIVMVVGGPNSRSDYHIDVGEELFYQLEGDMILKIIDDGKPVDITIAEDEMFLLPAHIPHSPRRFANTIGLVIERVRKADELDGFRWYCDRCGAMLYEEYRHIEDIVSQLPPIFERFYGNDEHSRCQGCGYKMTR